MAVYPAQRLKGGTAAGISCPDALNRLIRYDTFPNLAENMGHLCNPPMPTNYTKKLKLITMLVTEHRVTSPMKETLIHIHQVAFRGGCLGKGYK